MLSGNYIPYAHQLVADTDDVRAAELEQALDSKWTIIGMDWGYDYSGCFAKYMAEYARLDAVRTNYMFREMLREPKTKASAAQEEARTPGVLEARGAPGSLGSSTAQAEQFWLEVFGYKRRHAL